MFLCEWYKILYENWFFEIFVLISIDLLIYFFLLFIYLIFLQNYSKSIFSPRSCRTYPLTTLMWKENSQNRSDLVRTLENVGEIDISGKFKFHSKLFPNYEFGFNQRNLLVTTTWVRRLSTNHISKLMDLVCWKIRCKMLKE